MWKVLTILLLLSSAPTPSRPPAAPGSHPTAPGSHPTAPASLPTAPASPPTAPASHPTAPDPVISCSPPGPVSIHAGPDGRFAPPFPGWGHHHYAVSTTDDSAQFYFDQGLSLYYSFHLTESAASFKQAQVKDPRCAMAYWGEALAEGPYYNSAYTYKMPAGVLPVLDRMNALASTAGARERDLIAALNQRYSTDITDSRRSALNAAWSGATRALIAKYPGDNDIKALHIDGVMTEHAWDLWDTKGRPRPWTPELIKDCEEILKSDPDHPAALHYHIHLLEASLHPEATLASAERLKELMPGVAHMVHMASHAYQRTGNYDKGVAINDSANAAQANYSGLAPQLRLPADIIHYDAVESFCAMNGGMYEKGLASALKCRAIAAASGRGVFSTNLQYLSMMPEFLMVRMGKWMAILDQPVPDSRWVYATLISHFARGMAFLRTGNLPAAQACLDSIRVEWNNPILSQRFRPSNEPAKVCDVAEAILEGEILFAQHREKESIATFRRAISSEDELTYTEPKDWPLPARQFAGACLLQPGKATEPAESGKAAEAEQMYREDLALNPGNGWSLLGLAQSLTAQHKSTAAAQFRTRANTAFSKADQLPPASVY